MRSSKSELVILRMLDRVIEQACKEKIFSREDTPTDQRVEAAFLYYAGLSYRRVQRVVGRSYEAVRQWYHRLAHLFEPNPTTMRRWQSM